MACQFSILLTLALAALLPPPLLAQAGGARGASGIMNGPTPGRSEAVFKNDILAELCRDTDGDGKLDDWRVFARGYLVRLELDFNRDGEPDWRETWKRPEAPVVAYELQFIEGRWRILPVSIEGDHQHIARRGAGNSVLNYTGHAEKLIDGKWTDTFDDTFGSTEREPGPGDGRGRLNEWRTVIQYRDGVPVKGTSDTPTSHHEFEWKNGLATQRIQIVGVQKTVWRWENGRFAYLETSDKDGVPTRRSRPLEDTEETFRDGQWTGDFEENDGRTRRVYQGGHLVLAESVDKANSDFTRAQYDANGKLISRESTLTVNGVTYRTMNGRMEAKMDGKWTGDFERYGITYRDGRIIRQTYPKEHGVTRRGGGAALMATTDWPVVVVSNPSPEVDEWSDGAHTRFWARYDPTNQLMIYEARDLDGDGKPDLIADYDILTLIQPEPPVAPK